MSNEVYMVQNPAIGAAILWRFICGYKDKRGELTPFPLLFIVLPIIFKEELRNRITSTQKRKGLSKMSEKLFEDQRNDELYSINDMALDFRQLTLDSFNVGSVSNLFQLKFDEALVYPVETRVKNIFSIDTVNLLKAAEKLGVWCAESSMLEICEWLKVRF